MEFSKETIDKIGYYVYRLIDPRNGQTFYVGKGKGNRVFQHAKGILPSGAEKDEGKNKSEKQEIIQEILDANMQVIYVIQRWNLTDDQAIEVEAALIDCYPGLSNIQSGHGSEYGVISAVELEERFAAKEYEEPNFGYIIFRVQPETLKECAEKFDSDKVRYEATRGYWNVAKQGKKYDLSKYQYAFSVTNGIVRAVYRIKKWDDGRPRSFVGEDAGETISKQFVGKKIPSYYRRKGNLCGFMYSKNI